MSDHKKCPPSEKEHEKYIFRLSYFHRIEPMHGTKNDDLKLGKNGRKGRQIWQEPNQKMPKTIPLAKKMGNMEERRGCWQGFASNIFLNFSERQYLFCQVTQLCIAKLNVLPGWGGERERGVRPPWVLPLGTPMISAA